MKLLRHIPFTLTTVVLLIVAAVATNSTIGRLTQPLLQRFGFAPRDLWGWRWERIFTSALITHGRWTFWGAVAAIIGIVGSAELRTSPQRTALTFWGVHLTTLLALALPIFAKPMARDVGPSAGYYGCLGLLVATLPRRWQLPLFVLISAWLISALFLPSTQDLSAAVKFSADAVHLMAFPLGFIITHLTTRS